MTTPNPQPAEPDPLVARTAPADRGKPPRTVGAWRESGVLGMWKDRADIGDSVEFARQLREGVWKRRQSTEG
jgi:hypothetical protein